MKYRDYWNETHKKYSSGKTIYDNWLDYYSETLMKCKTLLILDW